MTPILIILALILTAICIILSIILYKNGKNTGQNPNELITMLQSQIQDLSRTMDYKMGEANKSIQQSQTAINSAMREQFGQSAQIITKVTEKLTMLDETNKQVVGFAGQLQSLENILKNPKQRGILGEYFLESLLKNILPPNSYEMQYKFSDGQIVDAAIFIRQTDGSRKIIPVDSKFSLETYNKLVSETNTENRELLQKKFKSDLKNRIDETSKYVKPVENTMDFAFMFIPSEGIYYDLLIGSVGVINAHDLIEYAFKEKRVIIVSPTSFYAYLQTVLQGLRALQIEESAKEIKIHVEQLGRHLGSYEEHLTKLGGHLGTTVNFFNSAYKEFGKIDKDIVKITNSEKIIEKITQIDKPVLE